jgi:adenylate cyclase
MAATPNPLIDHLLDLGLITPEDVPTIEALVRGARDLPATQLDDHDLFGVSQGLGRGVERIALAFADAAVRRIAQLPPDEREQAADAWLEAMVPPINEAFAVLLSRRLSSIVHRRIDRATTEVPTVAVTLAVGFVDLRGSTAFLLEHSDAEIAALADDLYAVGQAVATRHDVTAGKFLGDGVLLVSASPQRLRDATIDAVAELGARTALRAGAGIAVGRVVRRAGDWHGPPVNLAARLAELAEPDTVLIDAAAVDAATDVSAWRDVVPRGLSATRKVGVLTP